MRKYVMLGLAAVLCGCQSNVVYQRIGYGPEQPVAQAQCEIMAMGTEQGMWAWGSPEYVLGAEIGNAIANEARKQQFMKNCMIIKGWGQVPKAGKSYTVNGLPRKVDPQLAKAAYQQRKAQQAVMAAKAKAGT